MKHPAHPQLAHITLIDLIQGTEASAGVISVVGRPIRADWLGEQCSRLDIDTHGSISLLGRRKASWQRQASNQNRLCKEVPSPAHEPFTSPYAKLGFLAIDQEKSITLRRSLRAERDGRFALWVRAVQSPAQRQLDES